MIIYCNQECPLEIEDRECEIYHDIYIYTPCGIYKKYKYHFYEMDLNWATCHDVCPSRQEITPNNRLQNTTFSRRLPPYHHNLWQINIKRNPCFIKYLLKLTDKRYQLFHVV